MYPISNLAGDIRLSVASLSYKITKIDFFSTLTLEKIQIEILNGIQFKVQN